MTPDEARAAIGEQGADDYILAPVTHAKELPPSAQALAHALGDSRLHILIEQYARHDKAANDAQVLYKSTLKHANLAVLAATILGALMMAAQIMVTTYSDFVTDHPKLHYVVIATGILAGIAATAGSMWLFKAREGQLLERWLNCRAKAETDRGSYFATLAAAADDPALRLLKLEYFRRYQIDVQRNFFATRSLKHRKAAERTLRLGAYAVGLSSLSGIAGGVLGFSGGPWTALGALSVIGGALGAYAGAHEAMSQDKRNAERYENALEALELLAAKLDEVRKAIADGSTEALKTFVSAVGEQLTIEHRQWLEGGQGAKKAVETVEAALDKFAKTNPQGT